MRIKRFVNYNNLCLFISQLSHDYSKLGFQAFINKEYKCKGIYLRYTLGYKDYLIQKETGKTCQYRPYNGKFILEPWLYEEYFKFKNKSILESIEDKIVPELYNQGFIFTSVQESVQSFISGDASYEKGF